MLYKIIITGILLLLLVVVVLVSFIISYTRCNEMVMIFL